MDIKEVRKKIFERDGNKCYKCPSTKKLSMDHVNPKSIFHYHGIDNILTLCWKCNKSKNKHILSQNELEKIKNYLNNVNQKFTYEEATEMAKIIEKHFTKSRSKLKNKSHKTTPTKIDLSIWREYCNTHTWLQSQRFLLENYPKELIPQLLRIDHISFLKF
jgi:hypothetical protein